MYSRFMAAPILLLLVGCSYFDSGESEDLREVRCSLRQYEIDIETPSAQASYMELNVSKADKSHIQCTTNLNPRSSGSHEDFAFDVPDAVDVCENDLKETNLSIKYNLDIHRAVATANIHTIDNKEGEPIYENIDVPCIVLD